MRKYLQNSARRLQLERLERRELFSRDGASFLGVGSLTFSFAPDGTVVGQEVSALHQKFNLIAGTDQWQQAFAKAFQTWAVHSNINFGMVADNGAAAGVYGPTRGDERFGDIRITGFDFAVDTHAEAVSEATRSVGTWSGDMFYNTAAEWSGMAAIQSAALHEIGHILGLDHSTDPLSPMHEHGPSGVLELTAQDIQDLIDLHGPRSPDPNEESQGNNTIGRATEIKGGEDDETTVEGFAGNQVWIQFGDLHNQDDRDVYEIRTAEGYNGALAVEVRTAGLSLAQLHVELLDRNGTVLVESSIEGPLGGAVTLELPQTTSEGKYYLQVSRGDDPFWSAGDYSITVANPQQLITDGQKIAEWSRTAHRWYYDSERAEDGFSYQLLNSPDDSPSSDDDHQDDDRLHGVELPLVLSTNARVVYRSVGTINDLIDIDHYQFSAPKQLNGRTELTIDIEALKLNGLVPEIALLDEDGNVLPTETRVHGYGQSELVFAGVKSEQNFTLRLTAESVNDEHRTGSFAVTATFAEPTEAPEILTSGTLTPSESSVEHVWYVARPQLFGFSLSAESPSLTDVGQIWVSIYDEDRRFVIGMTTPWNELRSAPGIFLDAGTYFFQIATTSSDLPSLNIDFAFSVVRPSQPIGPLLGPNNVQPLFLCSGSTDTFCYPETPPTNVPHNVGPNPNPPLPPPRNSLAIENANGYFWSNNFLPTNPSNHLDVDGNGSVEPLDALRVINRLNQAGAGPFPTPPIFVGHLDSSGNGVVEPLDALLVINFLNTRG